MYEFPTIQAMKIWKTIRGEDGDNKMKIKLTVNDGINVEATREIYFPLRQHSVAEVERGWADRWYGR